MAKSPTEIFNDKVSLIFEYDKSSPLFARQANIEIENNNVERAVEILTDGLKLYPNYATAHILFAKALSLIGEYGRALNQVKIASDLLHSPKTYEHYLKEIENIKKRSSLFASSRGNAFIPELNKFEKETQPDLFEKENETNLIEKDKQTNIDNRLSELADEISSARISGTPPDSNEGETSIEPGYNSSIISETLAKIYVAQGEYKEAINVYEKLILKVPSKEEYYVQKINELNSRFDS